MKRHTGRSLGAYRKYTTHKKTKKKNTPHFVKITPGVT